MYWYTRETVAEKEGDDLRDDRGKADGHCRHLEGDKNGDVDNDDNGDGNHSGDVMMVENAQAHRDAN